MKAGLGRDEPLLMATPQNQMSEVARRRWWRQSIATDSA